MEEHLLSFHVSLILSWLIIEEHLHSGGEGSLPTSLFVDAQLALGSDHA